MTNRNGKPRSPRPKVINRKRTRKRKPPSRTDRGLTVACPPGATSEPWGYTKSMLITPGLRVDLVSIEAGGYCGKHFHERQYNMVCVEDGAVAVVLYAKESSGQYRVSRLSYLGPGESAIVPAGTVHAIEALRSSQLYQVYWVKPGSKVSSKDDSVSVSLSGMTEFNQLPAFVALSLMDS